MQALGFGTTNGNQVLGEGTLHCGDWWYIIILGNIENISIKMFPKPNILWVKGKPNSQELGDNYTVVIGGTLYFPLGYTS